MPVKNSRAPGEERADTLGSWSGESPVSRAGSLQPHCREQGYKGRAAAVCQPVGTGQVTWRPCLRGSSKFLGGELSKTNLLPVKPSVRPQGREKKKSQERDTPHTHTHTHTHTHSLARTPGTSIHVHAHAHGRHGTEEAMYCAAQRGPRLVQSQRKGGQETPHPLGELGQVSPRGPARSTEECRGHRAPKSLSQGRGTWAHVRARAHTHTHTQVHASVRTRGTDALP